MTRRFLVLLFASTVCVFTSTLPALADPISFKYRVDIAFVFFNDLPNALPFAKSFDLVATMDDHPAVVVDRPEIQFRSEEYRPPSFSRVPLAVPAPYSDRRLDLIPLTTDNNFGPNGKPGTFFHDAHLQRTLFQYNSLLGPGRLAYAQGTGLFGGVFGLTAPPTLTTRSLAELVGTPGQGLNFNYSAPPYDLASGNTAELASYWGAATFLGQVPAAPTPEPATLLLLAIGCGGFVATRGFHNGNVLAARRALAAELRQCGAHVRVVDLPPDPSVND